MSKIVAAGLTALFITASPLAYAQTPAQALDNWEADAKAFILNESLANQDEFSNDEMLILAQSGGGRWTCFARNRRGQVFSGSSHSRTVARSIAINRCWNRGSSTGCQLRNCR
jgi:hypothetical protein